MRATTEAGDTIDDPSEDALFMLFEDIEAGHGTYVIIDDLTVPGGQTYAQARRNDDGSYVVEHRDGDASRHVGTVAADYRAAHELITGWAFRLADWDASVTWERVHV